MDNGNHGVLHGSSLSEGIAPRHNPGSFFWCLWCDGGSHVVVVHSCKLQGHIKHKWEGYLGNVGQRCKAKNGENPGLPPLRDKFVRA